MFRKDRRAVYILLVALLLAILPFLRPCTLWAQAALTPPEQFFGFRPGTDKKIIPWDPMVRYFRQLEKEGSGRIKVVDMGPTTLENPFLLVIVSAAENISNLETIRQNNLRLSNPRDLTEKEASSLIADGKAVICQSMSLHASEIGGMQMSPELAYDLLHRTDAEALRILAQVVFLMIPSFNPDGAIMISDYYQKTLGTEYEGGPLPWLYHTYAGHDNNRDAFQTNLVESRYMAKILFRDWIPQAYLDHHHMGSYGARIYVPPYAEPVRPLADPLVWREQSWYGNHIAYKEEEAGLSGVLNMAQYSGWGHFGFHWITPFHNIAGMLTESASARIATPIFIHPDQLQGDTRGLPVYEEQITFPNPWPGGWWRLRDIVDRQKVSAWALLDMAARNKETVLGNALRKARRQMQRGAEGKPKAFVIPASQHDSLTADKLVRNLLNQGIEVQVALAPFSSASGMSYPSGSKVVTLNQPKMGLIRYLLGRTFYPDNEWTRAKDGSPIRPYDMATDTMFEFMGVRVDPVDEPLAVRLQPLKDLPVSAPAVSPGRFGYVLSSRWNDSYRAVNLLRARNIAVRRVERASQSVGTGDFWVASAEESALGEVSRETGVEFRALAEEFRGVSHEVKLRRIGLYQRYAGGNIDEGWTRLLLEQFSFPYATLREAGIKAGGLNARYDVIVLPNDSTRTITGEKESRSAPGGGGSSRRDDEEVFPPEYRTGIGKEGVEALQAFIKNGGTLITLGSACEFALEKLNLRLRNAVSGKSTREFWCPGSTLRARFDTGNPLAFGMPAEGLVLLLGGVAAFDLLPDDNNDQQEVVVRYEDRNLLQSGWLVGEQNLARKAAMVSSRQGKGRVVLFGFRVQHRAQTHGTYKLLFNALLE